MFNYSYVPTARGFQSYYGYYTGAEDYWTHYSGTGYDIHNDTTPDWVSASTSTNNLPPPRKIKFNKLARTLPLHLPHPPPGGGTVRLRCDLVWCIGLTVAALGRLPALRTAPVQSVSCPHGSQCPDALYSTHLFSSAAELVIARHVARAGSNPLFLYLAFQAMHSPTQAPQRYIDPFTATIPLDQRQTVAGMVTALDEGAATSTLLWIICQACSSSTPPSAHANRVMTGACNPTRCTMQASTT